MSFFGRLFLCIILLVIADAVGVADEIVFLGIVFVLLGGKDD